MLTVLIALSAANAATGPYAVGWQDLAFDDTFHDQGDIQGRVYYPALTEGEAADPDSSDGPYPLVAQLHGWLGQAWMYDEFSIEVASWGFVVVATDTETGANLNMREFAWDTRALIDHVEDESGRKGTWFSGLVDGGALSAMGHSMGGATLGLLIDIEPRIEHIVAVMPYEGESSYYNNVADFTGNALYITGSEDETALPSMVEKWFDSVQVARHGLFFEIQGAGHQAVTDFQWGQESMDDQVQLEAVQHLATRFLRAEVHGEEALYYDLIGPGSEHIPAIVRSASGTPAIWAQQADDGTVTLGMAGPATATADIHLAAQATVQDAGLDVLALDSDGPILADAPLVDGILRTTIEVPDEFDAGLYLQGIARHDDTQNMTRVIELVPGEPAVPADEEDSGRAGFGSCSTIAGSSTPGWLALAGLMLLWRRENRGSTTPPPCTTLGS
jgi:dienelactone hydrolase